MKWIVGSSTWMTLQPAAASSRSSRLMAVAMSQIIWRLLSSSGYASVCESRNSAMTCADTVPNLTGLAARAWVRRQIFAYSSGLRGLCSILPVTIGQRHEVWISCSSVPAS